jgi:hypothetical protein
MKSMKILKESTPINNFGEPAKSQCSLFAIGPILWAFYLSGTPENING